jgi:hypothetical protein
MKNFSLRLAPGADIWPVLRVTLRPAAGMPMTITRKSR